MLTVSFEIYKLSVIIVHFAYWQAAEVQLHNFHLQQELVINIFMIMLSISRLNSAVIFQQVFCADCKWFGGVVP